MNVNTLQEDGVYLAFDSTCGTCRAISARVRSAARGRIQVVPLNDPDVVAARTKIYRGDAPFKPTLLRVRDGDIQAWTGPTMGVILTKEIGYSDTLAVIQALGIERQSGHRILVRPNLEKKFGRRRFGQLIAGVAASVSIFASGSLTSAALADGSAPDEGADLELTDEEAQEIFERAVSSVDFRNAAPDGTVARLEGAEVVTAEELDGPARFLRLSPEGSTDFGDGKVVPGTGLLTVITSKKFKDGTRSQSTAIALSESELLNFVAEQVDDKSGTGAEFYRMNVDTGDLEIIEVTANGEVSEPVPDGAVTEGLTPMAGSDPCGGCAKNSQLSSTCKTSAPVDCVLGGVGCAGCVASCSVINAACITCVVATCGAALKSCCNNGSTAVCKPCKIVP